jgi:hypothetical protein
MNVTELPEVHQYRSMSPLDNLKHSWRSNRIPELESENLPKIPVMREQHIRAEQKVGDAMGDDAGAQTLCFHE